LTCHIAAAAGKLKASTNANTPKRHQRRHQRQTLLNTAMMHSSWNK
jgi:hypothetical protein